MMRADGCVGPENLCGGKQRKRTFVLFYGVVYGVVEIVRQNTDIPCAIGFGVSTSEQQKIMSDICWFTDEKIFKKVF